MQFQMGLVLLAYYCNYDFCHATPLIGENVRKARDNEFPFIVSLSFNNNRHVGTEENNHACGGTLITPQHVLTAAHCFMHVTLPEDIVVKASSRDIQNAKSIEVAWYIFYKQWANKQNISLVNTYHDVAIVKLLVPCTSPKLTPAKMTTRQDNELYGETAIIAGWGRIENNQRPRFLNTGEVTVLYEDDCLFKIKKFNDHLKNYVPDTLLCTKVTPPVLMRCGDSGGPLIFNENEVIGVNIGGCSEDKYAPQSEHQNYHASVNYYKTFILDVIKNWPKK